jgi:DNA-binding NarL/FixJ family response regulator
MVRIVFVDDEEMYKLGYPDLLEKSNPNYKVVGSFLKVTDAHNFIKKNQIDLLITDIKFPNSNVSETVTFIKNVKQRQPNCKVLAITKIATASEMSKVIFGGADGIHLKDLHKDFLKAVKDVLNGIVKEEVLEMKKEEHHDRTSLKQNEIEILEVINFSNKDIATVLKLKSPKAAEGRVCRVCKKMDMNRTTLHGWWQDNRHWYIEN